MQIQVKEEPIILQEIQQIIGYHLQDFIGGLSELMNMEV